MDNQKDNQTTEGQILEAARIVFVEKGFSGTTMQEIADKAGINKALLHYYFRTKERLFEGIFQEALTLFIPKLEDIFYSEIPFSERIEKFVDVYITLLSDNPMIPSFIIHEINRKPDRIVEMFIDSGIKPQRLINILDDGIKSITDQKVNPYHFLVNLFSMIIFPFISRPILENTILIDYQGDFDSFLDERKKQIPQLIINSINTK